MKGTPAYISVRLEDAKRHIENGEEFKAYEAISDAQREYHERNEEIEDIDVSDCFDQSKVSEIKSWDEMESINKARLIVGYIDNG